MAERYIANSLPDYDAFVASLSQQEDGKSKFTSSAYFSRMCSEIRARLSTDVARLEASCPTKSTSSPTSVDSYTKPDPSVYVGSGGIAYLHWKLSGHFEAEGESGKAREHLRKAAEAVQTTLTLLPRSPASDEIAFYIGSAGVHTLAAVIFAERGDSARARTHGIKVLSLLPHALSPSAPDEILFGRAGYLFCLLFLRKHADGAVEISHDVLRTVFDAIITSGRVDDKTNTLQFFFHKTDYVGAAHGTAGILYVLLQFPEWCREPANEPLIRATLERLLSLQLPSGNFASSLSSHTPDDKLVHWCHGAPGVIYTLHCAHQVFGDDKYQTALTRALAVVWKRGLLRKGFGACHGVAGNAYAFLVMYRYTRDERLYYNAVKMAEFTWSAEAEQAVAAWVDIQRMRPGIPDFPFSLMEGVAGVICFYCDILHPSRAAFPGYAGDL